MNRIVALGCLGFSSVLGRRSPRATSLAIAMAGWMSLSSLIATRTLSEEASEQAWNYFPASQQISQQALPVWAERLAPSMPQTTIALLHLDAAHRIAGPVPKSLRAAMRWKVARAHAATYFMRQAELDAMAAGESSQRWSNLVDGDQSQWSAAERAALEFAVAMTLESDVYPDAKFDDLVRQFSPEIVGSMVLHMAFANFQDRLAICLEVAQSDKPVLPPVEVAFDIKGLAEASSAPSSAPSTTNDSADKTKADTTIEKTASQEHIAPSELIWLDYQGLQGRLTDQRNRKSRLVSPPWSQVVKRLPPGLMDKPSDITWYQLSMGYAPELAVPFEYYLEIAGGEVLQDWDRVFGGSLFWMVTNSIHCPYCMGHCEMNWEVAGLKSGDIADLSKRLAENEWSEFNPPQQNALLFARKLTQAPEQVSKEDIQQLERDWGKARAIRIALQCSRYNYMVRISNGFQLQLESENVFWDYYGMPKPKDDQQSR